MQRTSAARMGQPQAMAAGPPPFQPRKKVVKHPARMEMMEKLIAKLEKPDQERFSSCLYPMEASCCSSAVSVERSTVSSVWLPL